MTLPEKSGSEMERAAADVVRKLRRSGHEACFAGGFVRDRLLGRPIQDIDIATSATPDEIDKVFPGAIGVGRAFGVMLVKREGIHFEVATFRSDGRYIDGRHPESVTFSDHRRDVLRRDFTINGMLYDPLEDRIIDLVGGREDLEKRLVRTIGDPRERFEEDKLRLMRAVRFACVLDFEIARETAAALSDMAPSIAQVSAERIRDELAKILTAPGSVRGVEMLYGFGLLKEILPEVTAMKGVPQPPEFHPEGDVWEHTLLTLEKLEEPTFETALAAILHDIGKPPTCTVTDRVRFNRHDKVGEEMAYGICRRLRLSRGQTERVSWLVGRHLAMMHVRQMRESKLKRLMAHEHFDDLLKICRADVLGSHRNMEGIEYVERMRREVPDVKPDPLITGKDLIALGGTPGPIFGRILRAAYDAQLEGTISTKEEALELARRALSGEPRGF